MDSQKNEINLLIRKLSDRIDKLPDGPVHSIEVDLILSIVRQLYEMAEDMRSIPFVEKSVPEQMPVIEKPEIKVPDENIFSSNEIAQNLPSPGLILQTTSKPHVDENITSADLPVASKDSVQEVSNEAAKDFKAGNEIKRELKQAVNNPVDLFGLPSIADKLKSDAPSLNDKITAGRNDKSLADRMQLKPISDLKASIGLNEKFQFINELFEGSAERYIEAINLLNLCGGKDEAELILMDLKSRYNWDTDNQAYKNLYEFIVRRYLDA